MFGVEGTAASVCEYVRYPFQAKAKARAHRRNSVVDGVARNYSTTERKQTGADAATSTRPMNHKDSQLSVT
jgi:hypothetical protein